MNKNTEKSANAVKEESKIDTNENPKLSNKEYKPTDEAMVVANTCTIVIPVRDQADEKHVPDNAEIQTILIATPAHEPKTKADDLYYEIFLLQVDCGKTCR